jgi:hypothetical protein
LYRRVYEEIMEKITNVKPSAKSICKRVYEERNNKRMKPSARSIYERVYKEVREGITSLSNRLLDPRSTKTYATARNNRLEKQSVGSILKGV